MTQVDKNTDEEPMCHVEIIVCEDNFYLKVKYDYVAYGVFHICFIQWLGVTKYFSLNIPVVRFKVISIIIKEIFKFWLLFGALVILYHSLLYSSR